MSRKSHLSGIIDSLVYSSIFPFTVAVGGSRGYSTSTSHLTISLIMAYLTMLISAVNPSFDMLQHIASLLACVNEKWFFQVMLYLGLFGAISNTAHTSFNLEEVSLISQAITHTLLYVTQIPTLSLEFHEVFLPALTFGILLVISPATPLLRKIKSSRRPIPLLLLSCTVIIISYFLTVRQWLLAMLGQDPILWILQYMTSYEGYNIRLLIMSWWVAVLAFGILVPVKFFNGADSSDNGEWRNKRRKFFHGIVVLLFLPSLHLDVPTLLASLTLRVTSLPLQCH
jgi:hypothetical protein